MLIVQKHSGLKILLTCVFYQSNENSLIQALAISLGSKRITQQGKFVIVTSKIWKIIEEQGQLIVLGCLKMSKCERYLKLI